MGEYRFSVYSKWQIGLSISFNGQIVIGLPFVDIHIAIRREARGYNFFDKWRN